MQAVQVKILGREYTLRTDQSAEQVQKVATFVEEKLAEMAGGRAVDPRDLTVLTLLNLAGQYLQLQGEQRLQQSEQEDRLGLLINQLEQAVSGCQRS